MPVDALGERPADTLDLRDVVDGRRLHAAQAAEMLDQRLAALGADTRDLAQHRARARLAAPRPVPDDGEAMRLVADRLNQVQAGMRRRELQRARLGFDDQLLETGPAFGALGDPDYCGVVHSQFD